jgi:hypothetical protein
MPPLDAACYALFTVARRRWWHELLIVTSLLVIAGVGVAAIWGPSIRDLFETPDSSEASEPLPTAPPPTAGGVL